MEYPIPEIPKDLYGKKLNFLEMCTYGICTTEKDEAFMSAYVRDNNGSANGIMAHLGFTSEEAKMYIQYMYSVKRLVNTRRKKIHEALKQKSTEIPF